MKMTLIMFIRWNMARLNLTWRPRQSIFLWRTQFLRNTATMDEWRNLKRILKQGYFDRENSGIDAYYIEGGSSLMAASAKRISTPAS